AAAVGVGGRLHRDEVTGVDEQLAGQVQPLHAAGGDGEPLGGGRVGGALEHLQQGVAQRGGALRGRVVEGVVRLRADRLPAHVGEDVRRDGLAGRAAHGEADDVVGLAGQQRGAGGDDRADEAGGARGQGQRGRGGGGHGGPPSKVPAPRRGWWGYGVGGIRS